jgi:hypothetical protein
MPAMVAMPVGAHAHAQAAGMTQPGMAGPGGAPMYGVYGVYAPIPAQAMPYGAVGGGGGGLPGQGAHTIAGDASEPVASPSFLSE